MGGKFSRRNEAEDSQSLNRTNTKKDICTRKVLNKGGFTGSLQNLILVDLLLLNVLCFFNFH